MKIKEYIMIKDKTNHPCIKEIKCCDWDGNLIYIDEIYRMLNEVFYMNKLSTEMSYVVALDHAKQIKGVCQVGHGNANETPTPMQNIFTFLLLTGAYSFVIAHNHVSNVPKASKEDEMISIKTNILANHFDMEFIGHMIINPSGYIVEGGIMDKCNSFDNEYNDEYKKESIETSGFQIEYIGEDMAATYVFGNRIVGKREDIETILNINEE